MNFFAHGRSHIDAPYFLAGTAVPDWLNVVNRKVRARSREAKLLVDDGDRRIALVARGIVQHHYDDDWFHRTRAFAELSWQFTVDIRDALPKDDGLRPSFLGHILVEILLDAELISDQPEQLEDYYRAMESIDPEVVQATVNRIAKVPTDRLAPLIPRFSTERFLHDYLDDERLLFRMNQVMRRVGLSQLPEELSELFPAARQQVRRRQGELLEGP